MYNWQPVLPVDLKNSEPASSYDGSFDQDMFERVLASANTIRVDIHKATGRNIKRAQEKEKRILIVGTYPQQTLKWGIEYCWKTNGDMIERVESFHTDG